MRYVSGENRLKYEHAVNFIDTMRMMDGASCTVQLTCLLQPYDARKSVVSRASEPYNGASEVQAHEMNVKEGRRPEK